MDMNTCEDCNSAICSECRTHYCCEPCDCSRSHNCACECDSYDQALTYAD